jgi:hypothetical protein
MKMAVTTAAGVRLATRDLDRQPPGPTFCSQMHLRESRSGSWKAAA